MSSFSTRRFLSTYGLVAILLVLTASVLFHISSQRRRVRQIQEQFQTLQHLISAAYQAIPSERFIPWLENANFQTWGGAGWNVIWLQPDRSVRWSIHPVTGEFPPRLLEVIRTQGNTRQDPGRNTRMQINSGSQLIHFECISPNDPAAGWILLRAPLPRLFLDEKELGLSTLLLSALWLGLFFLYHHQLRRHFQSIPRTAEPSGHPPVLANETSEAWAKQYVTLTSRKLSEQGDLFDALFDNLQDGILLLDPENRILRINTTAVTLLGESSDSPAGRALSTLADHADLGLFAKEIRVSGTYQATELPLQSTSTHCSVAGIPLQMNGRAGAHHVMLVLRDLTRIRQLEKVAEEYAVNVSHELKTPLTLILGYAEALISQGETDREFREHSLHTIERHAKRIIRIIDDLLRLAWLKNEAYTLGIPRSTVPIATVVEEAAEACREWARNADIAIETHIPADLVWHLNSGLIEEAIVNLVKNAILYALVGPVEIRVQILASGHLEIAVIDRGPGLRPEDAQHIFDRFYRAEKGRTRATGGASGSGLGLPIVQQIVEAHHGTARVETAPGEGCTFILEIPPA